MFYNNKIQKRFDIYLIKCIIILINNKKYITMIPLYWQTRKKIIYKDCEIQFLSKNSNLKIIDFIKLLFRGNKNDLQRFLWTYVKMNDWKFSNLVIVNNEWDLLLNKENFIYKEYDFLLSEKILPNDFKDKDIDDEKEIKLEKIFLFKLINNFFKNNKLEKAEDIKSVLESITTKDYYNYIIEILSRYYNIKTNIWHNNIQKPFTDELILSENKNFFSSLLYSDKDIENLLFETYLKKNYPDISIEDKEKRSDIYKEKIRIFKKIVWKIKINLFSLEDVIRFFNSGTNFYSIEQMHKYIINTRWKYWQSVGNKYTEEWNNDLYNKIWL